MGYMLKSEALFKAPRILILGVGGGVGMGSLGKRDVVGFFRAYGIVGGCGGSSLFGLREQPGREGRSLRFGRRLRRGGRWCGIGLGE